MEEILASIRRIIEDSDTLRQPVAGEVDFQEPEAAATEAPEGEIQAFRSGLDEQAQPTPAPAVELHEPPARAPSDAAAEAPSMLHIAQVHPFRSERIEAEAAVPPVDAAPAYAVPADDEPLDIDLPEAAFAEAEPDLSEVTSLSVDELLPASAEAAEAEPSEPRPAIISDRAGRQVAAAFGELTEAFAASRRRSFDDMAQEMLRPMLQDWLDNNLPTLVERLVREEIERVARGG